MNHTLPADLITAAREALQTRQYPPALLARIDELPLDAIRSDPWVALFQGRRLCRIHSRFAEATPLIDHALERFRARNDADGELWSLAEWIVMRYHANDFSIGLAGIEQAFARPMRPYLRAELYFGRFLCLIGLEQVHGAVAAGEAALAELETDADAWLQRIGRIQMLRNIAAGYYYAGAIRRSVDSAELAAELAQESEETAHMLPWCFYELGLAYWRQGQLLRATEALDAARRLAETWQHNQLWRWAVAAQGHVLRDQDRLDAALAAYQLAGCWAEDPEGPAFIQLRQGRLAEARWSCETSMTLAQHGLGRFSLPDSQMLLGLVELESGNAAVALARLEAVYGAYTEISFEYKAATAQLYRAAAALAVDQLEVVAESLTRYLQFAARENVVTCAWWIPELIGPLMIYAVQHGMEAAWAQRLLEERFSNRVPSWYASGSQHQTTELEIARRVQLSLLPDIPPVMPDLDIAACVLPAVEVGGDFVAYFPQGAMPEAGVQRQIGIAVGDISGKGLGAALLLSGTVVALSTVAANGAPPAKVAEALHNSMRPYTSRSQMNIAFCYAMLDQRQTGWSLRTVSAGAIPPLIRRANREIHWMETAGFPLGALATQQYYEATTELNPGDVMLLLSDGIVEAMNDERRLFGFDRLAEVVAQIESRDAHGIMAGVLDAVQRHAGVTEQQDDITIVVVRVLAGAAT